MVLTLYHYEKEPHKVFNCIKVTVDDNRTVAATFKEDSELMHQSFRYEKHYQRLTIVVD